MKRIISTFLLVISITPYSCSQESQFVKGKGYEGYIFPKEHFVFGTIENQKDRYTPTLEDINVAEVILVDSINYISKKEQPYIYSTYPSVNKKTLKKYKRQYVGSLTNDNDVVIWIKFCGITKIQNKDSPLIL